MTLAPLTLAVVTEPSFRGPPANEPASFVFKLLNRDTSGGYSVADRITPLCLF